LFPGLGLTDQTISGFHRLWQTIDLLFYNDQAEQLHHAGDDGDIGHIEYPGSVYPIPYIQEVGHRTVIQHSAQPIPYSTAQDKGNPDLRFYCQISYGENTYQHQRQHQTVPYTEKLKSCLWGQAFAGAQESPTVLSVEKSEEIVRETNRHGMLEQICRKHLRHLVEGHHQAKDQCNSDMTILESRHAFVESGFRNHSPEESCCLGMLYVLYLKA
jgi:hypothetical protein